MPNKPMKTLTINGITFEIVDEVARQGGGGSSSLSNTAIQLLNTILSAAVYTSDQSANISALISELGGSNVDNITVSDGVMTILGLANTPTFSNSVLNIT